MDEHLCANCGASLPPTGTYCLACDTPVADAERGLSVGQTEVVRNGRPVVAVAITLAVILVVGGSILGISRYMKHRADGSVSTAAKKAVDIVLRSEAGHDGGCPYIGTAVSGDPKAQQRACIALVRDDPGAHLNSEHAASVHRSGKHATVDLRGELVDKTGKRPFAQTISLVKQGDTWVMVWDGSAIAKS